MLPEIKSGESWVKYWKRVNDSDEDNLELYCQSCCYCYPDECPWLEELHPYDRMAETCPDFVPKDMYKPISKAKCWQKRLKVDSDYFTLPDCLLPHPLYAPFIWIPSEAYYKIMTKIKVLEKMEGKYK